MTSLREVRDILSWHTGRARFLFIHIPKNAGVSIRKAPELAGRVVSAHPYFHVSRDYSRAVAQEMKTRGEHHGFQHARWRDIHPSVSSRLTAVGIVRNPWDRVVSRWKFLQTALAQGKENPALAPATFEAFLEERHVYGAEPYYWHRVIRGWYPQADYVTDADGAVRVKLLRFERMSEEAPQFFGLSGPLRRRNRSRTGLGSYRDYYDDRTRQIVADWYAKDIALFGFDFDGSATRNVVFSP